MKRSHVFLALVLVMLLLAIGHISSMEIESQESSSGGEGVPSTSQRGADMQSSSDAGTKTTIVYGEKAGWLAHHAAEELGQYIMKLTGKTIAVGSDENYTLSSRGCVFLLGTISSNEITKRLDVEWALGLEKIIPQHNDSFIIKSFSHGDATYVVLAGKKDMGTLYAVYHYLDYVCGVGFFEDGERIPHLSLLPVDEINIAEEPKFNERLQFTWAARCLLKKGQSTLWTADKEWKDYLCWMVKNKFNWLRIDVQDPFTTGYGLYAKAYPGYRRPKEGYWPEWWPAEFVFLNTKKALEHARKLQVKLWYDATCNLVPSDTVDMVKKKFPKVKYSKPDPSYPMQIYIRDKATNEAYYENNLKALIRYYGKPDMYWAQFPVFEEEAVQEFGSQWDPELSNAMADVVKKYDPNARFLIDGWLVYMRYSENPAAFKQLLEHLNYNYTINSSYPSMDAMYKKFGYFNHKPWHYTEVDSFGGDDFFTLYIPYPMLLERAKEILTNPESRCIGFGTITEVTSRDPMLRYVYARLSWNPFRYHSWDELLKEYTLKRYGHESFGNMLKSNVLLTRALFDNRTHDDPYISGYTPVYRENNGTVENIRFETVRQWWNLYVKGEDVVLLEESLDYALKEKATQRENELYQKHLAALFHSYAAELYKFTLLRTYQSYFMGTSLFQDGIQTGHEVERCLKVFEESARDMDLILGEIGKVWSTRPELSTQKEIEEALSVPGASKKLVYTIRSDSALYGEGAFETMAGWYRPRMKVIVDDMRERLKRKETELVDHSEGGDEPALRWCQIQIGFSNPILRERLERTRDTYLTADGSTYPRFSGDTINAVESALAILRENSCTTAGFSDMMTTTLISKNYPFAYQDAKSNKQ